MENIQCIPATSITDNEKQVFINHLELKGLADDVWELFQEWTLLSTKNAEFLYLKVFKRDRLIGMGLFMKIHPFDLRTASATLRKHWILNRLFATASKLSHHTVYFSFRNLITSNLTRPFFYHDPEQSEVVMKAILAYLKNVRNADMVSVIDTAENDGIYKSEDFTQFLSPSEAWFDVSRYENISQYLNRHKSLKKNLKKRKNRVLTEIKKGPLTDTEKKQINDCLACSKFNSRLSIPGQTFFEDHIPSTSIFNSNRFIHIYIRVDGTIAGFHTFQVSGSVMGGVLGGINRAYSKNSFVYERVIVASLDYAIKQGLKRIQYSLIDNYTKLRLVDFRTPCYLYFYTSNAFRHLAFKHSYKLNDMYKLYSLEQQGHR